MTSADLLLVALGAVAVGAALRVVCTPHLVRAGLWHPSHSSLLTPDGIKKWLNPEVHPPKYEQIVTDFMAKSGVYIPDVLGNLKASSLISQALDPVWTGKKTAQEALGEVVPKANKVLEEEEKAP